MNETKPSVEEYAQTLIQGLADPYSLNLKLGDCGIRIQTNSEALRDKLKRYFSAFLTASTAVDMTVTAVEREVLDLPLEFIDWKREPGKSGRKDSYVDLDEGRLLRKVRTGMVFLLHPRWRIAAGPCLDNDNQVINFINAQYMSWLQQRDWLICHASGIVYRDQAMAIAGFSGGGKSTLMLHTMDNPGMRFLTNDRLFVKRQGEQVMAAGIAKLPRVNPGTLMNNDALSGILPMDRLKALQALPMEALWEHEEKYDVFIDEVYGHNRIEQLAPLRAFVILNWRRDSDDPMRVEQVNLDQRRDLLPAVMKSPGPFYLNADGQAYEDGRTMQEDDYVQTLKSVDVYEVTGSVDFDALSSLCQSDLLAI